MLPTYALKRTRTRGLGLFAVQDIPAHAVILECPFVSFLEPLVDHPLEHYVFIYPYTVSGHYTDYSRQSAVVFGDVSMINHHDRPNCYWDWLPRRRLHRTKALRPIRAGDELTFDYNWDGAAWDSVGGQQ